MSDSSKIKQYINQCLNSLIGAGILTEQDIDTFVRDGFIHKSRTRRMSLDIIRMTRYQFLRRSDFDLWCDEWQTESGLSVGCEVFVIPNCLEDDTKTRRKLLALIVSEYRRYCRREVQEFSESLDKVVNRNQLPKRRRQARHSGIFLDDDIAKPNPSFLDSSIAFERYLEVMHAVSKC